MLTGSCLCATIRYEIRGELGPIVFCHCSLCRKAHGTAFVASVPLAVEDFKITAGEHALSAYESSPGKKRYFCNTCASPIMSRSEAAPGRMRLRLGTMDSVIEQRPAGHIFAEPGVEWFTITDGLPQYAGLGPFKR